MERTSTEQPELPEALRLAEMLTSGAAMIPEIDLPEAAAELRRLHARVQELEAENQRLHNHYTVPTIESNSQDWANCDPAIAFHLIERHADNWADAGKMMQEFADAKAKAAQAQRAPLSDSALLARIRKEIDHAVINDHRTTPAFGKRIGEHCVKVGHLEATIEGWLRENNITQEKQG